MSDDTIDSQGERMNGLPAWTPLAWRKYLSKSVTFDPLADANDVTTWPVTPAQAESLKGRECQRKWIAVHADGSSEPIHHSSCDCHGTGRVRPSQVVARMVKPEIPPWITRWKCGDPDDGFWIGSAPGVRGIVARQCPFGKKGGVCEVVVRCDCWPVRDCQKCVNGLIHVARFRNIETAAKPGSDVEARWREQQPDDTLPDWAWVATVEWEEGGAA